MSGYSRAPRCSSGTRTAHSPRLPPDIDGDADISSPARSLNGCGLRRETQSIAFLSTPGIEALFSGDLGTDPSCGSASRDQDMRPRRRKLGGRRSPRSTLKMMFVLGAVLLIIGAL